MVPAHACRPRLACFKRSTGAVAAIEFAMLAPIFIFLLLFIFEFAFDLMWQSTLDTALDLAARKVQTGNAKTAQNGTDFINTYMCPNLLGLVSCGSVYVKIQHVVPTGQQDFYDFTSAHVPTSGSTLDLSSYASSGFCSAMPNEMILITAIYVAPTFVAGILPGMTTLFYNGLPVHAVFSSVALETEGFWTPAASGAAAAC